MPAPTLIVLSYLLLAVFVVSFLLRSLRLARLPVHLRWELAPVPHEKGKGHYGGSFLEEPKWWTKPREKDMMAELSYMGQEILFLKALFEHNRKLWWFSFPFHFGLYLLSGALGLVLLGGVAAVLGVPGPGLGILALGLPLLAGLGYGLGAFGAVGLFLTRVLNPAMSRSSTIVTFFNLVLLGGMFGTGLAAVLTVPDFPGQVLSFVGALFTANTAVAVPGILAAHVVFSLVFLAYLPFTQMMHFVAKYFTYHEVRWDDRPLEAGSKMEREIQELMKQPVSWAAAHIRADGKKNWVDIATDTGKQEGGK